MTRLANLKAVTEICSGALGGHQTLQNVLNGSRVHAEIISNSRFKLLMSPMSGRMYHPISSRNSSDDGSTTIGDADESQECLASDKSTIEAPRTNRRRLLEITSTIILTLLATLTAHLIYRTFFHNPHYDFKLAIQTVCGEAYRKANDLNPKYHCGNTSTEALARVCYDQELHHRFQDFGWRYFEDKNVTIEVFEDRLAESAGTREPFWVQHGFHVTHCELAWQRMHRAIQKGGVLTTHLLNFEHTHHCGGILELRTDLYEINSQIMPLLNTC